MLFIASVLAIGLDDVRPIDNLHVAAAADNHSNIHGGVGQYSVLATEWVAKTWLAKVKILFSQFPARDARFHKNSPAHPHTSLVVSLPGPSRE